MNGTEFVGWDGRITTVVRKELGKGLLAAMLKDLEIDKEEF